MVKIIILFLIANSVYAKQFCISGIDTEPLDKDFEKLAKNFEKKWEAATLGQVRTAKCKNKLPSIKQMKKSLSNDQNNVEMIELNEHTFKNEDPELVSLLDKLINKEKSLLDEEGVYTDLTGEKFKDCQGVICVSQKLFGKKLGIQLLYMLKNFGLNGSHLVDKEARTWDSKELNIYLKGVMNLPPSMYPC